MIIIKQQSVCKFSEVFFSNFKSLKHTNFYNVIYIYSCRAMFQLSFVQLYIFKLKYLKLESFFSLKKFFSKLNKVWLENEQEN